MYGVYAASLGLNITCRFEKHRFFGAGSAIAEPAN